MEPGLEVLQKIRDYSFKAGLAGLTMGVGSVLLFGESGGRNIYGMNIPAYIPIAVAGGVSSIAGDLAHDYVLPHIPQNEKMKNVESAGLNFATSGGAFVGSLMALTGVSRETLYLQHSSMEVLQSWQ